MYTINTTNNWLSSAYRFSFNGKEKDDEVYGAGNQYDYGARMYDARLGRFWGVDPLTKEYPYYTPYQFAGNKPIWATDLDGKEEEYYSENLKKLNGNTLMLNIAKNTTVYKKMYSALKTQTKYDVVYYTFPNNISMWGNTNIINSSDELQKGSTSKYVDPKLVNKTFEEGKTLITVGLNEVFDTDLKVDTETSEQKESLREGSFVWTHEMYHAYINIIGSNKTISQVHTEFEGTSNPQFVSTLEKSDSFKGTVGEQALKEIDTTIEKIEKE